MSKKLSEFKVLGSDFAVALNGNVKATYALGADHEAAFSVLSGFSNFKVWPLRLDVSELANYITQTHPFA